MSADPGLLPPLAVLTVMIVVIAVLLVLAAVHAVRQARAAAAADDSDDSAHPSGLRVNGPGGHLRPRVRELAFVDISCPGALDSEQASGRWADRLAAAAARVACRPRGRGHRATAGGPGKPEPDGGTAPAAASAAADRSDAAPALPRPVLWRITGVARAGELLSIVGPSGCGKSTLLNILAGQRVGAAVRRAGDGPGRGRVLTDGSLRGPGYRALVALVPQHDELHHFLTVEESVAESAELRLPGLGPARRAAAVADALAALGLAPLAGRRVAALSGGQRRRVSIALELVTRPAVLLLDEPTSGLDATLAASLIATLQSLAARRAIVCIAAMHQPASATFLALPRVLLLVGGRSAWAGPGAACAEALAAAGRPCPQGMNIADHLLAVASEEGPGRGGEEALRAATAHTQAMERAQSAATAAAAAQGPDSMHAYASSAAADPDAVIVPGTESARGSPAADAGPGGAAGREAVADPASRLYIDEGEVESDQDDYREHKPSAALTFGSAAGGLGPGALAERGSYSNRHHSIEIEMDHTGLNEHGRTARELHALERGTLMASPALPSLSPGRAPEDASGRPDRQPPGVGGRAGTLCTASAAAAAAAGAGPAMWLALRVLARRAARQQARTGSLLSLHLAVAAAVGLLLGGLYFGAKWDIPGLQNRAGAFFFCLAFFGLAALSALELFVPERPAADREIRAGWYPPAAAFLSKAAVDALLLRALPAVIFWLPFYFLMGLRLSQAGAALGILVLTNLCCAGLTIWVSMLCSGVGSANLVTSIVILFSLLFGGILLNVSAAPSYVAWGQKLSLFYYAEEALLANEVAGQTVTGNLFAGVAIPLPADYLIKTIFGMNMTRRDEDIATLAVLAVSNYALGCGLLHARLWLGGTWAARM